MTKYIFCIFLVLGPLNACACDYVIDKIFTSENIAHDLQALSKLPSGSDVCLDSPGGSFIAGVEFLRFLTDNPKSFSTRVSAESKCFSACAIAFMGGRGQSPSGKQKSRRVLEEGGRLGFHRPYITTADTVTVSRRDAVNLFDRIIEVTTDLILLSRPIGNSSSSENEKLVWSLERVFPAHLLQEMNEYGNDNLLYVDTYEVAASFGISFQRRPTPNDLSLENRVREVCDFSDRVRLKGTSRNFSDIALQKFALNTGIVYYLPTDYYESKELGKSVDPGCYVAVDDVLSTYTVWSDSVDEGVFSSGLASPESVAERYKYVIQFWQVGHE